MESLFWITLVAACAPLIAAAVPRRLVPEVVLLLAGGMLIGPYGLDLAAIDTPIDLLHELGLGMLFLLAGYEIEVSELRGMGGRRALGTWLVCLVLAFALVAALATADERHAEVAVAIALTSTALGTLLPILKDRDLMGTPFGRTVVNHGTFGELGPVLAMSILLGVASPERSLAALLVFVVAAVVVAAVPTRVVLHAEGVHGVFKAGADTTAQTTVRFTVLLLVALSAVAIVFSLDTILGAFAAGFILRHLLPGGDERLETKLDGLAFGFLIPVFFVTSGMAIDPAAIAAAPLTLLLFVIAILGVRGVPVLVATLRQREPDGTRTFDGRDSLRVALWASTGLPLIVAVTAVAVDAGQMSAETASVLVAGGALTVLLLPMSATLLAREDVTQR
ncbi:cation:proton antiporter [Mumia zhuanghuii]|uniref:Cation:proton antiporter n=1 Tax=Mumia zhuanghuii TaxID=2585211 RepID=A0A5C4MCL7_9ACTN|nr:cation:proton antiporter [Mumia zhuanghuii]TNC30493.1 cation:proton antiporter [Mumia zhuanghuii]TNC48533.1 cation:proton antiporter [Mumia zhuanghuii]